MFSVEELGVVDQTVLLDFDWGPDHDRYEWMIVLKMHQKRASRSHSIINFRIQVQVVTGVVPIVANFFSRKKLAIYLKLFGLCSPIWQIDRKTFFSKKSWPIT